MILLVLAAGLSGAAPSPSAASIAPPDGDRRATCAALAVRDPAAAEAEASQWRLTGGGFAARECLGAALANQQRWTAAATEFDNAARAAEVAHDAGAARAWAQGGNAWLAAGDAARARADLDAALAPAVLAGLDRGEAHLDRARALVAGGDPGGARADLDAALVDAAGDPLAWLLSATLARRMNDLPRAQKDIVEAQALASDDASVALEAGNIAAAAGDEAAARTAWAQAVRLKPGSDVAAHASAALNQFGAAHP